MSGGILKNAGGSTGAKRAATVFAPLSHPVLKSNNLVSVSKFLRERQKYERQIEEKKSEIPSLKASSYKVSVEMELLDTLVLAGEFEKIAPGVEAEDLTAVQIKQYLEGLVEPSNEMIDAKVERSSQGHPGEHKDYGAQGKDPSIRERLLPTYEWCWL